MKCILKHHCVFLLLGLICTSHHQTCPLADEDDHLYKQEPLYLRPNIGGCPITHVGVDEHFKQKEIWHNKWSGKWIHLLLRTVQKVRNIWAHPSIFPPEILNNQESQGYNMWWKTIVYVHLLMYIVYMTYYAIWFPSYLLNGLLRVWLEQFLCRSRLHLFGLWYDNKARQGYKCIG